MGSREATKQTTSDRTPHAARRTPHAAVAGCSLFLLTCALLIWRRRIRKAAPGAGPEYLQSRMTGQSPDQDAKYG